MEKLYEKCFEKIIFEIWELNDYVELIYVSMYNLFMFMLFELNEINGVVSDWNYIVEKELEKDKYVKIIYIDDLFNEKSDSS